MTWCSMHTGRARQLTSAKRLMTGVRRTNCENALSLASLLVFFGLVLLLLVFEGGCSFFNFSFRICSRLLVVRLQMIVCLALRLQHLLANILHLRRSIRSGYLHFLSICMATRPSVLPADLSIKCRSQCRSQSHHLRCCKAARHARVLTNMHVTPCSAADLT